MGRELQPHEIVKKEGQQEIGYPLVASYQATWLYAHLQQENAEPVFRYLKALKHVLLIRHSEEIGKNEFIEDVLSIIAEDYSVDEETIEALTNFLLEKFKLINPQEMGEIQKLVDMYPVR